MTCQGKPVWRWKLGVLSRLEVSCSRCERYKGCFCEKSGLAEKLVNPQVLSQLGFCIQEPKMSQSEAVLRWFYISLELGRLCGEQENQRCPWNL